MVRRFARGMARHWDDRDFHLSCDTALARGIGESRLELRPMQAWDGFIGMRQMKELSLPANRRTYRRYRPFPKSVLVSLDDWSLAKILASLHLQLLTGAVIYVDPNEIADRKLSTLECSVVQKKIALFAPGQYWHRRVGVTEHDAREDPYSTNAIFECLWERMKSPGVMRLHYSCPDTFENRRLSFSAGIREFLAYIQKDRCSCPDRCGPLSRLPNGYHIDHVIPLHDGGTNVLINLQAVCPEYNLRKRERPELRPLNLSAACDDPRNTPRLLSGYSSFLFQRRRFDPRDVHQIFSRYGAALI